MSFVVVIFVSRPATISIMFSIGMSLISYCAPDSLERFPPSSLFESDVASAVMCARSLIFILRGVVGSEVAAENAWPEDEEAEDEEKEPGAV